MASTPTARRVAGELTTAITAIERANSALDATAITRREAQVLMRAYAKVTKLGGGGVAALAGRIDDPSEVARASGTTMAKARDAVAAGATLEATPVLDRALKKGDVSLDQAAEIARAESAAPGSAAELLGVAKTRPFQVLRDEARRVALEAEAAHDLAARQRAARKARAHTDRLGMVHIHLELEPHIGR